MNTPPDPLTVICPLCGALPGERCDRGRGNNCRPHDVRPGEALRVQIMRATNVTGSL